MRRAWPELIVLIVVAAIVVLAAEIGLLIAAKEYSAPGWLAGLFALAAILLDLWATLRLVDWLFAGPARRNKERIVRFSP